MILFFLRDSCKRYGELKRCIKGVSHKVLIQQLKDLESDGIVLRTDYQEVPPRVDYRLTPLGDSLAVAMVGLCEWGNENRDAIAEAVSRR